LYDLGGLLAHEVAQLADDGVLSGLPAERESCDGNYNE
jgi:hypothetical protein